MQIDYESVLNAARQQQQQEASERVAVAATAAVESITHSSKHMAQELAEQQATLKQAKAQLHSCVEHCRGCSARPRQHRQRVHRVALVLRAVRHRVAEPPQRALLQMTTPMQQVMLHQC